MDIRFLKCAAIYFREYKKFGIKFLDFYQFYFRKTVGFGNQSRFLGKTIFRNSIQDFIHSVKEIFINETYKIHFKLKNPIIIDCGSNIGLSILYFKNQFPQSLIYGFEPDPVNYNYCIKNLDLFSICDGVFIENRAVWINNNYISFNAGHGLGSRIQLENDKSCEKFSKVKCTRLRDVIDKHQFIDLLKIDVEGIEDVLISDCSEVLSKVKNIYIEYHSSPHKPQRLSNILETLYKAGFRYYINSAHEKTHNPLANQHILKQFYFDLQLNIFAFKSYNNEG